MKSHPFKASQVFKRGFSLMELFVVFIILSVIAAFGVVSVKKMMYKNREREMRVNLTAIHGASQIYRSKYGTYWDPELSAGIVEINNNLGTQVKEQPPVEYSYESAGAPLYVSAAYSDPGEMEFTIDIFPALSISQGNPCCRTTSANDCPSIQDCPCAPPYGSATVPCP